MSSNPEFRFEEASRHSSTKGNREFRAEDPMGYGLYVFMWVLFCLSGPFFVSLAIAIPFWLLEGLAWIEKYTEVNIIRLLGTFISICLIPLAVGIFAFILRFLTKLWFVVLEQIFKPYFENLEKNYPFLRIPRFDQDSQGQRR